MTRRPTVFIATAFLTSVLCLPCDALAQERRAQALDPAGLERLEAQAGGAENVSLHPGTGAPRFIRLNAGLQTSVARRAPAPAAAGQDTHQRAMTFLTEYAGLFGLSNPQTALRSERTMTDAIGATHVTYAQFYQGVPVFAGGLKVHFAPDGELSAISGTVVPNIAANPEPSIGRDAAAGAALASVVKGADAAGFAVRGARLYIYRTGLPRAWRAATTSRGRWSSATACSTRELVYVDAHNAQVLDRVSGIRDGLSRVAYNNFASFDSVPNVPFWVEGDLFPTPTPRRTT